jgi:hypothetical protein
VTLVAGAAFGVASTGPFVADASATCGPEPVKICPTGPTGPSSTGPVVVDVDPTPAPSQLIPGGRFRAPDFRADRPVDTGDDRPVDTGDDGADSGADDGGVGTIDLPDGPFLPNGPILDPDGPGSIGSPVPPGPIDLPNGPVVDPDGGAILPGDPATPTGDPVDTDLPGDTGLPGDAGAGGNAPADAGQAGGEGSDLSTDDTESSDDDRSGSGIDALAFTGSGDTLLRLGAVLAVGGVAAVATSAVARRRRED